MVAPLARVLVKPPDEVFAGADPRRWHYTGRPDLGAARDEHAELVELLRRAGAEVLRMGKGRRCLMLDGNPRTRRRLERAGCEVWTYRGREISWRAEGGPTCLTRPLLRRTATPDGASAV